MGTIAMSHVRSVILGCLMVLALSLASSSNGAKAQSGQSDWRMYMSETRLFSSLMPGKPDEQVVKFRAGDDVLLGGNGEDGADGERRANAHRRCGRRLSGPAGRYGVYRTDRKLPLGQA